MTKELDNERRQDTPRLSINEKGQEEKRNFTLGVSNGRSKNRSRKKSFQSQSLEGNYHKFVASDDDRQVYKDVIDTIECNILNGKTFAFDTRKHDIL